VPAPTMESTPVKAVTKRGDKRSDDNTDSKKRGSVESVKSTQSKKTKLDDKELEKHKVNLERQKGRGTTVLRRKRRRRIWRKSNSLKREERRQRLQTRLHIPVFRNLFFGPKKPFLPGFLRISFFSCVFRRNVSQERGFGGGCRNS
jgi:hypothetical protein